jgi:hypothetical protein
MTHYAVLRHSFDIRRNPDRLGPPSDEAFRLALGSAGDVPSGLVGNVLWLISWETLVKTRHVLNGWFVVGSAGKRAGVVAQNFVGGNEGALFVPGLGPLEAQAWFEQFAESKRQFRDGEPTEIDDHVNELVTLAKAAGQRVPTAEWDQVSQGPASF